MQAGAGVAVRGNARFCVRTTEGGLQLKQLIWRLIKLKGGGFREPRHLLPPTTSCLPRPTRRCTHSPFPLYSRAVSVAAGGKRGGAGLAPPTRQVDTEFSALESLPSAIAANTLSTIAPAGWRCDATHGKSPEQVYPMCDLFQKITPPRVGKATSRHTPHVFYPLRIWRLWMGRGLGITSLSRSFRCRPLVTITLPPLPPPPPPPLPVLLSTSMVQGVGGGSVAANASATRWPVRMVRRSWRDLESAHQVYQP